MPEEAVGEGWAEGAGLGGWSEGYGVGEGGGDCGWLDYWVIVFWGCGGHGDGDGGCNAWVRGWG